MNKSMYNRIKASKEKEGGFTLIELLIVVVILGILAAVVIFASGGFKDKGALESCRVNVSSIKTASEAFHSDSPTSAYPLTLAAINTPTVYFDANGVTQAGTVISGKGWQANAVFTATAPPQFSLVAGGTAFNLTEAICNKP